MIWSIRPPWSDSLTDEKRCFGVVDAHSAGLGIKIWHSIADNLSRHISKVHDDLLRNRLGVAFAAHVWREIEAFEEHRVNCLLDTRCFGTAAHVL